jgi:outer membrane protein TolC
MKRTADNMQRRSFRLSSALAIALSSGAALAQVPETPATPKTSEPFLELLARELDGRTGLTSAEAAQRAVRTSPELARSGQELREASADVDRALAGYVPELRVAARYRRLSNPGTSQLGNLVTSPDAAPGPVSPLTALVVAPLSIPVLENEYVLEARLSVPVSDYVLRVAPRHAAAERGQRAANENLTSARLRIATDARVAYYDWVRARLGKTVAERALSQLRARSSDVERALAIGTASRADLLRVDAEVAQSELLLTSAENEHAIRERELATLLHDPEGTSYTVGEDVRQPLASGARATHEQLLSRALESRRELRALDAAIAREQSLGRAERAGLLPRLDVFAGAQYANPNPRVFPQTDEFRSSWDAGAQLSWTFSEIPAALADTAQSDARAQALAADRRRLLDQITNQVFTAARTLEQSESAIKSAERGLAAAEESYRMRQILYQNGQATTVELLDAEAELTRARFAMLDTQIDARVAAARLEYALGTPIQSEPPR